jgi:hypothetical protein
MSYQQKNITVSLASFTLILVFFLIRVFQMVRTETFIAENVFRLWGITIAISIVAIIVGTILAHILSAIVQAIQTGEEDPKIEDVEDERDKLIDLKGTRVAYLVSSLGVFAAMLTFVFGQTALVMFTILIFSGLIAQIVGDISRLVLYQRGF